MPKKVCELENAEISSELALLEEVKCDYNAVSETEFAAGICFCTSF